jgi:hypothetical protein
MQAIDGVKQSKASRRHTEDAEPRNKRPRDNNFASTETCCTDLPIKITA